MLTRVAKYDVIDEIGHGGMATVFRARDTLLNREVALKVMHPHLQGAKEARARFAREALTIARLKHPSILEIYDYSGEDSDTSYIATELLTGPTLKHFAELHPDIPAEVVACIAIQVARALGAAHAEGVIHRDVKPENVMLHEGRTVKLTDFGIAQLVDVQGMTTTGQVLGSPAHMAPEQIEGRDCDARSDLFSLGTVMYLLATGELPFQGKNPHQVLKQISDGYFRDPLQLKPQIGGRLAAIMRRCLQIDPAQRYQNAGELECDLLSFVGEAGIEDPGKLLADYLKEPAGFTRDFVATVLQTQLSVGERAQRIGDIPRAMDAWNRVLAYDERNVQVLAAVQHLGRRTRLRTAALWAGGLTLTLGTVVLVFAVVPGAHRSSPGASAATAEDLDPPQPSAATDALDTEPNPQSASPLPAPLADDRAKLDRRPAARPTVAALPRPSGNEPRHVVLRPEPVNVAVSIDGSLPRDFGPSFRELDLPPGDHIFKFSGAHECCVDGELSVKIPPGPGTTVVEHRLKFRPAGLYVVSNTPANVVVDGGSVSGRTRSVIQVPQAAGMFETHQIRITADGHQAVVREVRLRAGQVETIEVQLEKLKDPASTG
ncbi:MAG TPA: protein kinase [Polyangiales bacterium]